MDCKRERTDLAKSYSPCGSHFSLYPRRQMVVVKRGPWELQSFSGITLWGLWLMGAAEGSGEQTQSCSPILLVTLGKYANLFVAQFIQCIMGKMIINLSLGCCKDIQ